MRWSSRRWLPKRCRSSSRRAQQGYTGPIIGGNGFNSPAVLNQAGDNAEGLIVGGAWNYGQPEPQRKQLAVHGGVPSRQRRNSPDQFAAQAYTGAWLVARRSAAPIRLDHAAVNDRAGNIKDMATPLGIVQLRRRRRAGATSRSRRSSRAASSCRWRRRWSAAAANKKNITPANSCFRSEPNNKRGEGIEVRSDRTNNTRSFHRIIRNRY